MPACATCLGGMRHQTKPQSDASGGSLAAHLAGGDCKLGGLEGREADRVALELGAEACRDSMVVQPGAVQRQAQDLEWVTTERERWQVAAAKRPVAACRPTWHGCSRLLLLLLLLLLMAGVGAQLRSRGSARCAC